MIETDLLAGVDGLDGNSHELSNPRSLSSTAEFFLVPFVKVQFECFPELVHTQAEILKSDKARLSVQFSTSPVPFLALGLQANLQQQV